MKRRDFLKILFTQIFITLSFPSLAQALCAPANLKVDGVGSPSAESCGSTVELPVSVGPALYAANDTELTQRLSQSLPGQHIVLTGASYTLARTLSDGDMVVNYNLQKMPIIKGKYILSGRNSVIYGLDFNGANIGISGDGARLLRSKIHDLGSVSPVGVSDGNEVIIAYNEIYRWGSTTECGAARGINIKAPFANGEDGATRIKVYRNYIHDQIGYNPETCTADGEVIAAGQTGASGRAESRFEGHFHHNLIVNCLGDNEGFGVKSSYNKIEYNHLIEVRGFNLRLGGYNTFIGNRLEGSRNPGGARSGYKNLSLGEVFAGTMIIGGGNMNWGDGDIKDGSFYFASESVKIIGVQAGAIRIGEDKYNLWDKPTMRTLVENSNVNPYLGAEQFETNNRWNQPASMTVPAAIKLGTSDVGPLSAYK